jgi:hypothetical protein
VRYADDEKQLGNKTREKIGGGEFAEVKPTKPADTLMKSGMKCTLILT